MGRLVALKAYIQNAGHLFAEKSVTTGNPQIHDPSKTTDGGKSATTVYKVFDKIPHAEVVRPFQKSVPVIEVQEEVDLKKRQNSMPACSHQFAEAQSCLDVVVSLEDEVRSEGEADSEVNSDLVDGISSSTANPEAPLERFEISIGNSSNSIPYAPLVLAIGCTGPIDTPLETKTGDEENAQNHAVKLFDRSPQQGRPRLLSSLSHFGPYECYYSSKCIVLSTVSAHRYYVLDVPAQGPEWGTAPFITWMSLSLTLVRPGATSFLFDHLLETNGLSRCRVIPRHVIAKRVLINFPFDPGVASSWDEALEFNKSARGGIHGAYEIVPVNICDILLWEVDSGLRYIEQSFYSKVLTFCDQHFFTQFSFNPGASILLVTHGSSTLAICVWDPGIHMRCTTDLWFSAPKYYVLAGYKNYSTFANEANIGGVLLKEIKSDIDLALVLVAHLRSYSTIVGGQSLSIGFVVYYSYNAFKGPSIAREKLTLPLLLFPPVQLGLHFPFDPGTSLLKFAQGLSSETGGALSRVNYQHNIIFTSTGLVIGFEDYIWDPGDEELDIWGMICLSRLLLTVIQRTFLQQQVMAVLTKCSTEMLFIAVLIDALMFAAISLLPCLSIDVVRAVYCLTGLLFFNESIHCLFFLGGIGWSMIKLRWNAKYASAQTLVGQLLMQLEAGHTAPVVAKYRHKSEMLMCSFQGNGNRPAQSSLEALIFWHRWNNVTSASFIDLVYSDYLTSANFILGGTPRATIYMVGYGSDYQRQVCYRACLVVPIMDYPTFVNCFGGYATWFSRNEADPNLLTSSIVGGLDAYANFIDPRGYYDSAKVFKDLMLSLSKLYGPLWSLAHHEFVFPVERSLETITLLYPNLEGKVLIKTEGIVMNVDSCLEGTLGNLANFIWDPG